MPGTTCSARCCPRWASRCWSATSTTRILARRLARRENRADVTAMPYGPSVPHMFIVVFVIMLPIYLTTKDPIQAWEAGLAWAFIIGVIVLIGAFIGPFIRKYHPAGRACSARWPASRSPSSRCARPRRSGRRPGSRLPVLGIILVGFFTNIRLPGGIPIGLAALLVGTAIGWIGGYMSVPDVDRRGQGHRHRRPDAATSTCCSTGWRTWRRCWPPPSRSASTTSPRR